MAEFVLTKRKTTFLDKMEQNSSNNRKKEMPGIITDFPEMQKYCGYMTSKYRYHVYLPTRIFDPRSAIIKVYQPADLSKQEADSPETVVEEAWVQLKSLPTWNVKYQCLQLSRRDKQKVNAALRGLEKKFEGITKAVSN